MAVKGIERKQARWGWYFVLPSVLFFVVFSFYPIINAIAMSFAKKNLISPLPARFVGLANYRYVLASEDFWGSVKATGLFTFGTFLPLVVLSLILAVFITRQKRFTAGWQLIIYSPAILSSAVASLIWMIIFTPTGIANQAFNTLLGTNGVDVRWMSSGSMLVVSTMIVYFWKYVGYFTVLYITGITKIPTGVYEAATIDGASRFQAFFRITLPLLKPTTALVSVMAMLQCLKTFSTQYMFTQAGAPKATINVITLNIYNTAMREYNVGRASVMSVLLFFTMLVLTVVQLRFSRSEDVTY